jgi:hypothetical protein
MARRVIWSHAADLDLQSAVEYIARDSQRYAATLARTALELPNPWPTGPNAARWSRIWASSLCARCRGLDRTKDDRGARLCSRRPRFAGTMETRETETSGRIAMCRLPYIAIGLVFLLIAFVASARVSASGAYIARVQLTRVCEGQSREEVRQIMASAPKCQLDYPDAPWGDCWQIEGGYRLWVRYTWTGNGDYAEPHSPGSRKVEHASLSKAQKRTFVDSALELAGFPKIPEQRPVLPCLFD